MSPLDYLPPTEAPKHALSPHFLNGCAFSQCCSQCVLFQRCGSTLIICPHKIKSQWEREITGRTKAGALKVSVGVRRSTSLRMADVRHGAALK